MFISKVGGKYLMGKGAKGMKRIANELQKCGICGVECSRIFGHIKRHHDTITIEDYCRKYGIRGIDASVFSSSILCGCGCGAEMNLFENLSFLRRGKVREFIHGHHAKGRKKSVAEKCAIGKKNSENMKRYMAENPDVVSDRLEEMAVGRDTDEYREKMSIEVKRRWAVGVYNREEYRNRAFVLLEQGKIGPQAPYKTEWKHNPFTNADEYMHSSWESKFLDVNIERNNPVTKVHNIRIPYNDENSIEHIYIPDFIGLEDDCLYEIKPDLLKATPKNLLKFAAAERWCELNNKIFIVLSLGEF
jgi:hypothetical protein